MRCPACAESADPADRFCEACGVELRDPHRASADRTESDLGSVAGVSDRGRVHARNEDAMAVGCHPDAGGPIAAVVCDGVSTVRSPELASQAATAAALAVLLDPGGESGESRTRDAATAAATAVGALSIPGTRDAPSCTFVSAFVDRTDPDRPEITVGWVGDSRAYWLADPGSAEPSRLLTADHSWAAEMVLAGVLDEAAAMADSRAHAITRWLGAEGAPEPGVVTVSPAGPGVVLLCSDGLWNYLPDAAALAAVALPAVARGGPHDAAGTLTAIALDAGGRDNITVVLIPVTASHEDRSES